ncbi:MAG: hypothetical protein HY755_12280 [Nitrospirae bacterium]|nr:hypothetical protein [Nitrospirota bacterium]
MEDTKEKKKRKPRKRKEFRLATSFTMRLDNFSLEMLDRIAYDEDMIRAEAVRSAIKHLFLKKYGQEELEELRQKFRGGILREKKL